MGIHVQIGSIDMVVNGPDYFAVDELALALLEDEFISPHEFEAATGHLKDRATVQAVIDEMERLRECDPDADLDA